MSLKCGDATVSHMHCASATYIPCTGTCECMYHQCMIVYNNVALLLLSSSIEDDYNALNYKFNKEHIIMRM